MFKFEGFQVGQHIKAYNFKPMEGREEDYVSGPIIAVNVEGTDTHSYAHYVIICEHNYDSYGMRVRIPMETTFDYDGRITLL